MQSSQYFRQIGKFHMYLSFHLNQSHLLQINITLSINNNYIYIYLYIIVPVTNHSRMNSISTELKEQKFSNYVKKNTKSTVASSNKDIIIKNKQPTAHQEKNSLMGFRKIKQPGNVRYAPTHRIKVVSSMKEILIENQCQPKNFESLELKECFNNNLKDKSRSPRYNEIKRKRLIREEKSKSKGEILCQKKIMLMQKRKEIALKQTIENQENKNFQSLDKLDQQQKIVKQYISQLQNILVSINQQKQKTDRKPLAHNFQNELKQSLFMEIESIETSKKNHMSQQDLLKHSANLKNTINSKQLHSSLIASIINKTKQQKKVINFKEVRNRYREEISAQKQKKQESLEAQKKIETIQNAFQSDRILFERKKIQSLRSENGIFRNKTGRKILRAYNPFKINRNNLQQNNNILNQPVCNMNKPKEKVSVTIIEEQNSKIQLSDFNSPLNIKKVSRLGKGHDQNLNFDFSQIQSKKNQDSFLSDEPKQLIKNLGSKNHKDRLLDLLDLDTGELKNIIKPKQKKRKTDLEKWKKNFPVGFFEDIPIL